jgi:hypothetical protein
MIIVVSWYSDGSAPPEVRGFPNNDERWNDVMGYVKELADTARQFRAFRAPPCGAPMIELGLPKQAGEETNGTPTD